MAADDPSEELARILQDYSAAIDAITDPFTQELIDTPAPSLIYHYTNDCGLRGILESGQLWFTDIFNLNGETGRPLEHIGLNFWRVPEGYPAIAKIE